MQQYRKLTSEEKRYLRLFPLDVFDIKRAKDTALKETKRLFGYNGTDDESDAFRHCFWSALLASTIGPEKTFFFTSAHESALSEKAKRDATKACNEADAVNNKIFNSEIIPACATVMDLHNNKIGIAIGEQGKGKSDQDISQLCLLALYNDRLIVRKKTPGLKIIKAGKMDFRVVVKKI